MSERQAKKLRALERSVEQQRTALMTRLSQPQPHWAWASVVIPVVLAAVTSTPLSIVLVTFAAGVALWIIWVESWTAGRKITASVIVGISAAGLCVIVVPWLKRVATDELIATIQTAVRPAPTPVKPPTFVEVEQYWLRLGDNTLPLRPNARTAIMKFDEMSAVQAVVREGKVLISARLYGGSGAQPVVIDDNQFAVSNTSWDRNFSDTAFEVVDSQQLPMLQIIYKTPRNVVVYGIFETGRMHLAISEEGMHGTRNPLDTNHWPLRRIFRYPSRNFPGIELTQSAPPN